MSRALRCPVVAGVRYTVNVTLKGHYEVATFEDMQNASHGLKRLGVLRMDVDNLGHLFSHGFRKVAEKTVKSAIWRHSLVWRVSVR